MSTLDVVWLHGDTVLSTGELLFLGEHDLIPGDKITCIARATDEEGLRSNALTATAILEESTFTDRLSGLAGVTGFAVAGQPKAQGQNSILVAILVILFALNAVLIAKRIRIKKSR